MQHRLKDPSDPGPDQLLVHRFRAIYPKADPQAIIPLYPAYILLCDSDSSKGSSLPPPPAKLVT
ncbi:hypothetical protein BDW75DRAFT_207420 [Aspergillus navahoensis]